MKAGVLIVGILVHSLCQIAYSDIKDEYVHGVYDLSRMKQIKPLTLPRILLYDKNGGLINRSLWPKELEKVNNAAGDAYCCITEDNYTGTEPPEDCKKILYGEDIKEHFDGLKRAVDSSPISYADVQKDTYLIVEYYADWCPPCIISRKIIERFMDTNEAERYTVLLVDFSKLNPGK